MVNGGLQILVPSYHECRPHAARELKLCPNLVSLCNLSVLCVSVVNGT